MDLEKLYETSIWEKPSAAMSGEASRGSLALRNALSDHLARFNDGLPKWDNTEIDTHGVYETLQKRSGGSHEAAELLIGLYIHLLSEPTEWLTKGAEKDISNSRRRVPTWNDARNGLRALLSESMLKVIERDEEIMKEVNKQGPSILFEERALWELGGEIGWARAMAFGWAVNCVGYMVGEIVFDALKAKMSVGEPQPAQKRKRTKKAA